MKKEKKKPQDKKFSKLTDVVKAVSQIDDIQHIPELTPDTRKLLATLYRSLKGPFEKTVEKYPDDLEKYVKPPVLVSFHPKLSLLNNNVHESLLAVKLAEKLGQIPLWIPYVYDTATHSSSDGGKIRAPTYAYIEGSFVQIRAASQIHGNIIKTEKTIRKNEINKVILELEKLLIAKLGKLQRQLNQYNFGHYLFDLKRKVMGLNKKKMRNILDGYRKLLEGSIKGSQNLGEYLGNVSQKLLHGLEIPINMAFIERVIPEILPPILTQIIAQPHIQDDPSQLEGLFNFYNVKDKSRVPIQFTGDAFIAFDDNANRLFDGGIKELAEGLDDNSIIPTGPALILLFSALGCSVTIGGLHTQEYYPEYISNANNLLKNTGFNHNLKVIGYGGLRLLDTRSITDILAVNRILEKVGSRTVVKKQSFSIPHDIVDHLNFLAGKEEVPSEYHDILETLLEKQKIKPPAMEKELKRYDQISGWNNIPTEELPKHVEELQPSFRALKLAEFHPERIKIAIETLAADAEMRKIKMAENLEYEQHILGGKILNEEPSEEFADREGLFNEFGEEIKFKELFSGMLIRSKRVPTLLELSLYKASMGKQFLYPVSVETAESEYYYCLLKGLEKSNFQKTGEVLYEFETFPEAFEVLIPASFLPKIF